MAKKNKNGDYGFVFSTDEYFEFNEDHNNNEPEELAPEKQKVRIWIDRKHRKGKEATLIKGYIAPQEALQEITKELKKKLGAGGSVIENEILIQGNKSQAVLEYFLNKGIKDVKLAGGS